jgi:hypothetical protein
LTELEEMREERDRLQAGYNIACRNLLEMNERNGTLTDALNTATLLLDELITEMRLANVTPSAKIIVTKANFDRAMRKLLGRTQDGPLSDA